MSSLYTRIDTKSDSFMYEMSILSQNNNSIIHIYTLFTISSHLDVFCSPLTTDTRFPYICFGCFDRGGLPTTFMIDLETNNLQEVITVSIENYRSKHSLYMSFGSLAIIP